MTAQESREKAFKHNTESNTGQLLKIQNAISKAVQNGEYSCYVYESLREDVRKKLVSDGFIVGQTQFDRNESMTLISWESPS